MPYDPFYIPENSDDVEAEKFKLVSVRRPPICDTLLIPLEWSNGDHNARKRHRPDANYTVPPLARNAGIRKNHEHLVSTDKVKVKEVVKIVERVINNEPITIMGVPPLVDDRVRYVVNFILEHVTSPHVEVEAKLGLLIEKSQNVRAIELVPVLCETPIRSESNQDTKFVSDVGSDVFTRLNERLNRRVEETANKEQGGIRYLRTREMDLFWPNRVRETKERRTGADGSETYETIRVQTKKRLGDLNVLCPGRIADIRYSASSENDCAIPASGAPDRRRIKDRISYKYEYLSVDITSVSLEERGGAERTYEVEAEIDASTNLFGEVCKYRQGDGTSKLFEIAASLVNTVRLLLED